MTLRVALWLCLVQVAIVPPAILTWMKGAPINLNALNWISWTLLIGIVILFPGFKYSQTTRGITGSNGQGKVHFEVIQ